MQCIALRIRLCYRCVVLFDAYVIWRQSNLGGVRNHDGERTGNIKNSMGDVCVYVYVAMEMCICIDVCVYACSYVCVLMCMCICFFVCQCI